MMDWLTASNSTLIVDGLKSFVLLAVVLILRFILALVLSTALPILRAQDTPAKLAEQELPALLTIYKDLHTHPELSTFEERSSAIVAKELKAAGCEVTDHVGQYEDRKQAFGVVGVGAEFLADAADVHVNAAVKGRVAAPEDCAHKFFAGDDAARRLQEFR